MNSSSYLIFAELAKLFFGIYSIRGVTRHGLYFDTHDITWYKIHEATWEISSFTVLVSKIVKLSQAPAEAGLSVPLVSTFLTHPPKHLTWKVLT